ncbi:MAG: polysaccharide biosynthesis tyrosine autokinase [Acidobacteriia bacterium]|nr:polysaccharide biosynthesis tyrosine autokinase [Terriglobia bacterium]
MAGNESLSPIEPNIPQPISSLMPTTVELEAQGTEGLFTLSTFWHIIVKRGWTITTATLIVVALTAVYTYRMVPVYRATTSIEVEPDLPQLQSINDLYRQVPPDDYSFIVTQMQVLQSDNLAWQTIEQLGLDRSQASTVPKGASQPSATQIAAAQKAAMIGDLKGGLHIEPLKDSRIVEVSFEGSDPEGAARIVNALVSNYIEFSFRARYDFTRHASGWMEQQIEDLRAKVEKSQQALVDYERQNLIITVGDKQNITEQRLQDLSRDYTAAQSDRVQKESIYDLAKSNEGQIGIVVQNELLLRLEEKYTDLKTAYADASAQYGPNFPKVVRLRDQLNEMQSLIEKQRKQAIQKVRNDYLAAVGRENLLAAAMGKQRGEVGQLNQRMIEHNILKREFETNQQLYENILQRLKDATISAGLQATNIHVIDQATPPTSPIRPNKTRNILASLLVGLIFGVTLAFVREALDSSVRSTEEAERLINAPALAIIPVDRDGYRRKQLPTDRPGSSSGSDGVGLAVLKRPSSHMAESFRSLRTSVLLSTAPRPPQTLLVTSAQMGEGKTSTALNLAIAFSQRGGTVLIVDADLRRPNVAKALGVANEKGLSSFLTGAHTLQEVLIQSERVKNLWVLPAGPRPPDPAELLSSHMMGATLKGLSKHFTQIIIDSPPVLAVTDGVVLSALVDGVILVVASGVTARGALARTHRILENARARVLGIVLNKVDLRFDTYYGSYYGPYSQSYYDDASVSSPSHASGGGHSRSTDSPRGA